MLLVYASRTGNVKRFMSKLDLPSIEITEELTIEEPYVLVTYTDKQGQVPDIVSDFVSRTSKWLRGVAASGNRNWGAYYARSADIISKQFHVPILLKFEISGFKKDVNTFKKRVEEIQ